MPHIESLIHSLSKIGLHISPFAYPTSVHLHLLYFHKTLPDYHHRSLQHPWRIHKFKLYACKTSPKWSKLTCFSTFSSYRHFFYLAQRHQLLRLFQSYLVLMITYFVLPVGHMGNSIHPSILHWLWCIIYSLPVVYPSIAAHYGPHSNSLVHYRLVECPDE